MRILVGCECSGAIRRQFRERGHDAWSCDLAPAEDDSEHHLQMDVLEAVEGVDGTTYNGGVEFCDLSAKDKEFANQGYIAPDRLGWDLFIVHPECRYLCGSGMHWNKRRPERAAHTADALEFALRCWNAPVERICLENPSGILSRHLGPASQWIQPYQFGHDASKKTGLWLKNLPPLPIDPAKYVPPRIVWSLEGVAYQRWANQTDSGQNRLGPSPTRSADRARTYDGIAEAMARTWGGELPPVGTTSSDLFV